MQKAARLGMRVDPVVKAQWEITANGWGYPSLSAFITDWMNWVIQYESIEDAKMVVEGLYNAPKSDEI